MNQIKKILCFMFVLILTVSGLAPYSFYEKNETVKAASADTLAYKQLLEQGKYEVFDLNYFYLLDINRDGTEELICMRYWSDNSLHVFTQKNGQIVYLGTSGSRNGPKEVPKFYYSKKYKSLCRKEKYATFGGGLMGPAYEYSHISGTEMKDWKYTAVMKSGSTRYYAKGKTSSKYKFVSKKKQKAFYKKYFAPKYIKKYTLLRNTLENREAVLN